MTTTTTTDLVLDALERMTRGRETMTIPEGLDPERAKWRYGSSVNGRPHPSGGWFDARVLYEDLATLTGLTQTTIKRLVRENLLATGQVERKGESTATQYALKRVVDQEQAARVALDAHLREVGTRLEGHGVEVLGRGAWAVDKPIGEFPTSTFVSRIKVATSPEDLLALLDGLAGQG